MTTAFTAGVVEPWMNGIGGGGYMVVHPPDEEPPVVTYPMVAPAGARPEMFPLSGAGSDAALFGWPAVVESANVFGYRSVAVPGTVAGLALALQRWGTISLAEALAPAIRWAEEGIPVSWHTTLKIAGDLGTLKRFPATAAIFLDGDGNPPVTIEQDRPRRIRQEDLARTLRAIASEGPRVMYEGSLGRAIADDLAANGAPFTRDDFANYQAQIAPALTTTYGGSEVHTVGGGTGGTTLVESLNILTELDHAQSWLSHPARPASHGPGLSHRVCRSLRLARRRDADRDPGRRPYQPEYARSGCGACGRTAWSRSQPRPRSGLASGTGSRVLDPRLRRQCQAPGQMADGSTTHLSVMDRDGMAVSCTQTLLSLWGSRVTTPGTGCSSTTA